MQALARVPPRARKLRRRTRKRYRARASFSGRSNFASVSAGSAALSKTWKSWAVVRGSALAMQLRMRSRCVRSGLGTSGLTASGMRIRAELPCAPQAAGQPLEPECLLRARPKLTPLQTRLVEALKRDGIAATNFHEARGRLRALAGSLRGDDRHVRASVAAGLSADRTAPRSKSDDTDLPPQHRAEQGAAAACGARFPRAIRGSGSASGRRSWTSSMPIGIYGRSTWSSINGTRCRSAVLMPPSARRTGTAMTAIADWCRCSSDFSDTDDDAGRLQYVDRQSRERFAGLDVAVEAVRPEVALRADEVRRRTQEGAWRTMTGPAGLIVFADSSGLHRRRIWHG